MIVITIILIVSAVALPTITSALNHRQASEGARILQGALVGARDEAIHKNRPSGIRLLPDPAFFRLNIGDPSGLPGVPRQGPMLPNGNPNPNFGQIDPTAILASNRVVPIAPAADYSEGLVTVDGTPPFANAGFPPKYPGPGGGVYPVFGVIPGANVLMIEESLFNPIPPFLNGPLLPNPPTDWFWNIRLGDRIQINQAGPWYTVVGPLTMTAADGNSELFVNVGPPNTKSPLERPDPDPNGPGTHVFPEFLFLVNGVDDNRNGWVDEGWDGIDNNLDAENNAGSPRLTDELAEWMPFTNPVTGAVMPGEAESWQGSIANHGVKNQPYTIQRRPAPIPNAREVALPSDVVVDLTTWGNASPERSRVPINLFTGYADILVNPDGTVLPVTLYSTPSSAGMGAAFYHLWLAERADVRAPADFGRAAAPFLPVTKGLAPSLFQGGAELKGEYRLLTLFVRSGNLATAENPGFDDPARGAQYNPSLPFLGAQQGR